MYIFAELDNVIFHFDGFEVTIINYTMNDFKKILDKILMKPAVILYASETYGQQPNEKNED